MGDFAVAGSDLKKMIKLAKKGPISFGFNPGKSEEDAYCGMHRTKPPAQIGKEAKSEGDGSKFAFGLAEVEGKEIRLTCERQMPGLAKRFKKFLKFNKVMLNVVILDADGNVLESDIEEGLPDDPELNDDTDPAQGGANAGEGGSDEVAPPDAASVMKRLAAMADQIKGLPPQFAAKLAGPFKQLVEFARAGELDRAIAGLDKLDSAILMLDQQPAPAADAAPADPQLAKLQQAAAALRGRVSALPDEKARTQLAAALDKVDGHVRAKEVEAAITLIRRIGDILKGMADGGSPASDGPTGPDAARLEWDRRFGAIEAQVNAALTRGLVRNIDDLRKLRDWAVAMAADGAHDKALQALPRIEGILATMSTDGAPGFEAEIAPDVRPFARARVIWASARQKMLAEVKSLEAAIVTACEGDEELREVSGSVGLLSEKVVQLDARLETKMDEIVKTAAGDVREKLKADARAMIAEYRALLEDDFFQEVDADSGFGSFAVTSTATDALQEIAEAIS